MAKFSRYIAGSILVGTLILSSGTAPRTYGIRAEVKF